MFHLAQERGDPIPQTLILAEALQEMGHHQEAGAVLDALAQISPADSDLALLRAERAWARGDAEAVLKILIHPWEAGADSPLLHSRLALATLALGLNAETEALTEPPWPDIERGLIRWILELQQSALKPLPLDKLPGGRRAQAWELRNLLQLLSACGRADLQALVWQAPLPFDFRALLKAPSPQAEPSQGQPLSLTEARRLFEESWIGPHSEEVFAWAWTVSREIAPGERALLLCPWPGLEALFQHTDCVVLSRDLLALAEALPLGPCRFQHVISAFCLEGSGAAQGVFKEARRVLKHKGQLHLLSSLPKELLEPWLEKVGFFRKEIWERKLSLLRAEKDLR